MHKLIFILSPRALNRVDVMYALLQLNCTQWSRTAFKNTLQICYTLWKPLNHGLTLNLIDSVDLPILLNWSFTTKMKEKSRKLATRFKHVDKSKWRPFTFKNCLNCLSINFKLMVLMLLLSFIFQGCQMILYLTINIISISAVNRETFSSW